MLTDTHCHLDFNQFEEDRGAVIRRAVEAGLARILIPGLDLESSRAAAELAESLPMLYAAVGFHPTETEKWNGAASEDLRALIGSAGKVVAVGEIGLDYYWIKEAEKRNLQRRVLEEQLQLAREVNRPVILHLREANDAWSGQASSDLLEMLKTWCAELTAARHPLALRPGVLHSFNGSLPTARQAIALHFYLGVTGPVTYKNAAEKRRIIRDLPLDSLLIETDAPFLAPVPWRGKRNEPAFVTHIADKIAEIHMTTRDQVAQITSANAARLFGWGG